MSQAAKKAGVNYVEIVHEPQCAAAYFIHHIKGGPNQLQAGDVLMIPDIGGETGDFVSYKITDDIDNGAGIGLETVGTAEGDILFPEFRGTEHREMLC